MDLIDQEDYRVLSFRRMKECTVIEYRQAAGRWAVARQFSKVQNPPPPYVAELFWRITM